MSGSTRLGSTADIMDEFLRCDRSSEARISLRIRVSVLSRLRVRSSNHSMMTAETCSRNVSNARRTVTPRSICAIAWAISSRRAVAVDISIMSRPCSSMRSATWEASSRVRLVISWRSSMTSSKECLSSFHITTANKSCMRGSPVGCKRRSVSPEGTMVSSGDESKVSRIKSRA